MQTAYKYFKKGVYFLNQEELGREITEFIQKLSGNNDEILDGETILHAIEAQHGFLVQQGMGIYSFSHLTFQEYFTALYIVENMSNEEMSNLFKKRLNDKRWDEIFLIATRLLPA
jgi:predicted NACHT family NTPase